MKNILFVSAAFPPKSDPECLQTAKYFKYLSAHTDLSISVITSSIPTLFMPYDSNLDRFDSGYTQKIEIPIYEWKILNFILRKLIPNGIDYPDSKFTFHLQPKRVIRTLETKPDIIYSRANPLSSSILAYKLAEYYKIPWVMHLSDPWVDSPVKKYNQHQYAYHSSWEKKCFERAQFIGLTSQHTIDFYKKKYPLLADKFLYFPNVYDPADIDFRNIDFSGKLKIVYTGGLAGDRSPRFFFEALKELLTENPHLENFFEIKFAGPIDRRNLQLFDQNENKQITHIGQLSYARSLELIKEAHLLLNIDLPIKQPTMAMFFASKILDYFLAGRKIISLSSKGSASEAVLKNLNTILLEYNDVQGIKQVLKDSVESFNSHHADFFTLKFQSSEFDAHYNANRLAGVFRSL